MSLDWKKRIAPQVEAVPPSGIRKFFDIAAEMEDVISLGVGEPDFEGDHVDRKSTRLNSSHSAKSRMPSSA